jgi:hypothetical protein
MCLTLLAIGSIAIAADTVPVPKDLKRNQTIWLKDANHVLMTITYEYFGKEPVGKIRSKHDYKEIDTDFYVKTINNHTPYIVELLTMKTWPPRETKGVNIETKTGRV